MRQPRRRPLLQRLALGAVAGAGATLAMHGMMTASGKLLPASKPPMNEDPGEFMAKKAHVPEEFRKHVAKSLQLGYGMTSGVLYAATRPRGGSAVLDGSLLGLGVWAAGYLGWLPAADLMPPISEHEPQQVVVPIVQHVLFGVVVVGVYDAMTRV